MPLKFAVVREDPELEAALVERLHARAVLLVASGGCTALTLAQRFPNLALTAFDLNPRQLQHVRDKAAACGNLSQLNIDDARSDGLSQSGEFEGLFRILKHGLEEFIAPATSYFDSDDPASEARRFIAHRYWPALFATTFNEPLLHAMFGPDATQHAAPGSYPDYFRRAFERGLLDENGRQNPFLQHVFLGCYRRPTAPAWMLSGAAKIPPIELIEGSLHQVAALDRFDLYSLSNVFDWSSDALLADWGARLSTAARPGAAVLIRQLNNRRDVASFFPSFRFDDALGAALHARDRSLFYERVLVGFRA